jgi:isopropylmalate/homocitrate/citramalate synthase
MKKYELQNPDVPQLFEKYFDYSKVPLIDFEDQTVEMCIPEDIWITDTTFRDGQQARPPYEVEHIVKLFKYLHELGGKKGVIRQSEFFLYSAKDREAVEKCLDLGYKFPEVTGWIRAVEEDFKLVKSLGLKETGILTSASDYHIYLKLKSDRKKILEKYLRVVDAALTEGVIPRCHFEDITRADFEGFVIPFAQALMERAKQSGIPIKIRACDTMGFGLPYPTNTLPRSVPKIFEALHKEAGVPHKQLEWHGHNDFHKVLINGTTSWLYNCSAVNGTLLGWGERTGNPPIEGVIMDYIALKGGDPEKLGIDTNVITRIARYYHDVLGDRIPDNYPFVGKHFNTTRAGIHADGAIKDERIYNIFDTGKLLNRPLTVSITDKSGVSGIAFWINNYFNLEGKEKLTKNNPGIQGIYKWVMKEYDKNRVSSISTEEMLAQTERHVQHLFHSDLEGLKMRATSKAKEMINKIIDVHPEFKEMDVRVVEPIMREFMEHTRIANLIYVVDRNGKMLTDFISQPEDENKYKEKLTESNFADRNWYKAAIDQRKVTVSDFYVSKITEELCVTVSRPIFNHQHDLVGVLGIDINFENLTKLT